MHIKSILLKKILLFLLVNILGNIAYAQNGTYNCTTQGYYTQDKSESKSYHHKQIIIIDINNLNGGDVTINIPSEDHTIKYSIAKIGEVLTDIKERTITRTYEVYLVMMGEKINKTLLAIVENMDNKNIGMWIYNEKYKTYNTYSNLKKITN